MRSLYESQKEFLVSKLMFKKLLNSKQIKEKLGKAFIDSVQIFMTNHIEPHESRFCFYLKCNLRHYGYTNSIHEGTNIALKYNSAPIGPSTKIEKSLVIMCNNTEHTVKKKSKIAALDFCGTKIYPKLNCANKVVSVAEAIMLD